MSRPRCTSTSGVSKALERVTAVFSAPFALSNLSYLQLSLSLGSSRTPPRGVGSPGRSHPSDGNLPKSPASPESPRQHAATTLAQPSIRILVSHVICRTMSGSRRSAQVCDEFRPRGIQQTHQQLEAHQSDLPRRPPHVERQGHRPYRFEFRARAQLHEPFGMGREPAAWEAYCAEADGLGAPARRRRGAWARSSRVRPGRPEGETYRGSR